MGSRAGQNWKTACDAQGRTEWPTGRSAEKGACDAQGRHGSGAVQNRKLWCDVQGHWLEGRAELKNGVRCAGTCGVAYWPLIGKTVRAMRRGGQSD